MTTCTFLHTFETWAFRTGSATVLGIFRIAFGTFLLFYWSLKAPHVAMLFSREGLVIPHVPPMFNAIAWIFTPPSAAVASTLFGLMLLSLLCLTIGFLLRISAIIAMIMSLYYWVLSLHLFPTSFDRLFIFFLLVLACSGADKALSVHMMRTRGSFWTRDITSLLPQRILLLQILATYLGVGWQKIVLPDWQGGEILPYSFLGLWGTKTSFWLVRQNLPLFFYDAATFLVTAFEVALPFGLFLRKTRAYFIVGAAIFHLLIAVFLHIWWFLVLLPAYVLLFEPEDIDAWLSSKKILHRFAPRIFPNIVLIQ